MRFTYAYKTSDGRRHEAAIDAESREAVFEALRRQGIRAIKVVAADGSKANGEKEEGRRKKEKVWRGVRLASLVLLVPLVLVVLILYRKAPERQANSPALSSPRHQIYGDPAIMEGFERGDFSSVLDRPGDRMLAVFAQPGRLMCQGGFNPKWLSVTQLEALSKYAKDELEPGHDLPVDVASPREVRELKQIVNGMRREMREYLANGNGTLRSYWRRLNERTCEEAQIYERTLRELENETDQSIRAERNAALRAMGLRTVPRPRSREAK